PPGLFISPFFGNVSGFINSGAAADSPYTVTVTATDGTYQGSTTFTWTVADVTLDNPGNQSNANGAYVYLPLHGQDVALEPLTYTITGLPPGLQFNPAAGVVQGQVSAAAGGAYQVTATASDGTNTATVSFVWQVGRLRWVGQP